MPPEALFQMAARVNKKRSFLFVSKVLGKHIPVNPHVSLLSGAALALLYVQKFGQELPEEMENIMDALQHPQQAEGLYQRLKSELLPLGEDTLFISFAETATALGHSMYDLFAGTSRFLHTTREEIREMNAVLQFEEEHSHATAHRCYALQSDFFTGSQPVVLIDDEITTGNTALNIIRDLHGKHPRSRYTVVSLLDWRSDADKRRFEEVERELNVNIHCLSLMSGQIEVTGGPLDLEHLSPQVEVIDQGNARAKTLEPKGLAYASEPVFKVHDVSSHFGHVDVSSIDSKQRANLCGYLRLTGRFGLHSEDNILLDEQVHSSAAWLKAQRTGTRTLCMGTGEFMYIPMRISAEMGEGVSYQSSTRSPIYPAGHDHYAVNYAFRYESPDDSQTPNFFYNIPPHVYDEMFVFMERTYDEEQQQSMMNALKDTRIPVIHLIYFNVPASRQTEGF